ncbi:MAG TPA: hypothetical protein DCP54_06035 [Chryseobacterium sp.]|nr:hypothetical protein [Chryseobacterium sp.]
MESKHFTYNCYFILFFHTTKKFKNKKVDVSSDVSQKINNTYLINGTIFIRASKIIFDLFISKEKQGIMLNEEFYDLSKGNILFFKETKKGKFKIKQI